MEGSGEGRREDDGTTAPNRQDNLPGGEALSVEQLRELVLSFTDKLCDDMKSLSRQDDKNKQAKLDSLRQELQQLQKTFKDNINTAIATDACQRETINTLSELLSRKLPNTLKKLSSCEGYHSGDKEAIKTVEKQVRAFQTVIARKDAQFEKNERRIAALEQASFNGILDWKIPNVSSKRRDGKVVDSPLIFTRQGGYKMGLRIYLNGDGEGEDTHVSLHLLMMKGDYDAILGWDSNFRPKKPTSDVYVACECPLFLPLTDLDNTDRGFVLDDEMTIKVVVKTADPN